MDIQHGVDRIDARQYEKIEDGLKSILVTQSEIRALRHKLAVLETDVRNKLDFIIDTLDGDYWEDRLTFCITPNGRDYYGVTIVEGRLSDFYPVVRPEEPKLEFEDKPYNLLESDLGGSVDARYSLEK